MNQANIVGRLVRDVELKYTGSGIAVVNFVVAVDRNYKNAQGEYEADFIDCVAWRKQAEFISQYFKKGTPIAVTGSIQTRNYENNEGRKVYVTEVVADNVGFVPRDNSQTNGQSQRGATNKVATNENPFENVNFSNNDPLENNNTEIDDDD
jgi:single-strand DNA-binding protein